MAEITNEGYQDIRDYIESDWIWIELRDDLGDAILRVSTTDGRVSWTHDTGAQELELTITVTGSDGDITLPQTFKYSAIFDRDTGGDAYTVEEFSEFTMEEEDTELTVRHRIQVPEITE